MTEPAPDERRGPLTDEERKTLKTAAFGAVYLVSSAEPGFFAMLKESFAASEALADATGLVKDVLNSSGLPTLPRSSPEEAAAVVLPALEESVAILREKSPGDVEAYRQTVIAAVQSVAGAAEEVNPAEAAMIARVRAALGSD